MQFVGQIAFLKIAIPVQELAGVVLSYAAFVGDFCVSYVLKLADGIFSSAANTVLLTRN